MLVTLRDFKPVERYPPDDNPFIRARIEEAPDVDGQPGVWELRAEVDPLDPPEPDPADPLARSFSVNNASAETGTWWRVVFIDADGITSTAGPEFNGVPDDGYPTLAELVDGSHVDALTNADATRQEEWRAAAIAAVEGHCGQQFGAWAGTFRVPGNGRASLQLPRRLSALTGIDIGETALTIADVELSQPQDRITFARSWSGNWLVQAEAEAIGLTGPVRSWPSGIDNVAVTGIWGYTVAEWPEQLTRAVRADMEDQALADETELSDTVRAFRHLGLRSVRQGGLSADLTSGLAGVTLGDRAVSLLSGRDAAGAPFVWQPAGALA